VAEIARAFVALGVEKVRLTGGEPLLRADLPELVRVLKAELRVRDVALTTNGWLLAQRAAALREAGLDRVSVSLDSLDPVIAGRMNGLGFSVDRVLAGIAAAEQVGLAIKINTVVQRGVNDHEIVPLAEYFRERGHPLRFIEFMDVGNTNHWDRAQVLPAREIVERIHARWPLEPVGPAYRGEVAARYRYVDGRGEIGLISSVTEPFCRDCHRARLSADGRFFTCLFAGRPRAGAGGVPRAHLVGADGPLQRRTRGVDLPRRSAAEGGDELPRRLREPRSGRPPAGARNRVADPAAKRLGHGGRAAFGRQGPPAAA
jgi:cyclic pyranopterin phosphate synthase